MMASVELKPVDTQGPPIHIPLGKTTVGRGPFLGCTDKRISRNHAVLEVTSSGELTLTPIHSNPCFKVNGDVETLTKGVPHSLCHGDRFSMLPSAYQYEVVITCTKTKDQDKDTSTEVTKQEDQTAEDRTIEASSDNGPSPLKTATNRIEVAERKANNYLASDDTPSTSSNTSNRKRVLPGWLIEAAEEQGKTKQERTPPKRKPVPKAKADNTHDSGGRNKAKQQSASKVTKGSPASVSTPEEETNIPRVPKTSNDRRPKYDMSEDSDEDLSLARKTKVKVTIKNAKSNNNVSDEDLSDHSGVGASKNLKPNLKKKKKSCAFGTQCYRKNPAHFKEFAHPGDADYDSEPDDSGVQSRSPTGSDADDPRPECEFGLSCYRKNPQHRKDYKHTAQRQPPRAAAKKAKAKVRRRNDESGDEDDDSNDSFIDDDSDDYKPDSGEESDEDPSVLRAEAEKFKRNKNLLQPV